VFGAFVDPFVVAPASGECFESAIENGCALSPLVLFAGGDAMTGTFGSGAVVGAVAAFAAAAAAAGDDADSAEAEEADAEADADVDPVRVNGTRTCARIA
jgi:hypothetical protein